jgi:hypothetical protein
LNFRGLHPRNQQKNPVQNQTLKTQSVKQTNTQSDNRTSDSEILAILRGFTSQSAAYPSHTSLWVCAAQLIWNAAGKLANEANIENGQWILINRWKEREARLERALDDIRKARLITKTLYNGFLREEEPPGETIRHLEQVLRAIDELQRHPRFRAADLGALPSAPPLREAPIPLSLHR